MTTLLLTMRIGVRNVVEEEPFLMTQVGLDPLKFDVEDGDQTYPLVLKVKELLERETSECGDVCLILQLRYATISSEW